MICLLESVLDFLDVRVIFLTIEITLVFFCGLFRLFGVTDLVSAFIVFNNSPDCLFGDS